MLAIRKTQKISNAGWNYGKKKYRTITRQMTFSCRTAYIAKTKQQKDTGGQQTDHWPLTSRSHENICHNFTLQKVPKKISSNKQEAQLSRKGQHKKFSKHKVHKFQYVLQSILKVVWTESIAPICHINNSGMDRNRKQRYFKAWRLKMRRCS
jgi:hypothetical protein